MAKAVDSLDEKLIRLLQQDAHRSSEVLAKQLDVSPATVRRRVSKLVQKGVVRIAAIPDSEKVGLHLAVIIALKVDYDGLKKVMSALPANREVSWACTTTGRFDILAMARFHATEELTRFLQSELTKIDGIRDSETFVCLGTRAR